jgi:DNA-binding GntR family transcriptional regulator
MSSSIVTGRIVQAERTSIAEQTYQQLRSMIFEHKLAPGTVFTERRLAEAINISRTPLRTAISRLEGEGLVERLPNSSVIVRTFSIDELLEILLIRRLLESEAACLAAGRLPVLQLEALRGESERFAGEPEADFEAFWRHDDTFHGAVAEACGKPLLGALIADLRRKARMCHVRRMPKSCQAQAREHLTVLDALAAGDGPQARAAMADHLDKVRSRLLTWLGGV